jgi:hypothetical protein
MKKLSLLLIICLIITQMTTAQYVWRPGEMQIVVPNDQPGIGKMAGLVNFLKINTDITENFIRCYVIPSELKAIEKSGILYQTEITDLNQWSASFGPRGVPTGYYTVVELNEIADSLALNFPDICTLHTIGLATGSYSLMALKISDNSSIDEDEAEILFDGGIHGDEIGGPENMIRFARDLCLQYGNDPMITDLVNNREIWIYYCVNPYGRENMTRYNANGIDINRDCGYMWNGEGNSPSAFSQPETKAYRKLLTDNQFVIHCSYHSGTEYISFPWSYRGDETPDHAIHNFLAQQYAGTSGYSGIPYGQGYNGMYAINGSTKDFGYGSLGAISWSVEISLSKQPPASQVVPYYLKNKPAMLAMADYAGYGIEGLITDVISGATVPATIFINDYFPITNDPLVGDYHKYLNPGAYQVRIEANGYASQTISDVTVEQTAPTILNIALTPAAGHYAQRIIACQIPNNNYNDEGNTPASIGQPDNIRYSLGRNGFAIIDMGDTITDGEGADFIVYENDNSPEGYQLYAGNTMDGPWLLLGNATGNHEFDLAGTMLTSARFVKIKDDGDGQSQEADAGFDLDAIEGIVHLPPVDSTGFIHGIIYDLNSSMSIPGATIYCGNNMVTADENAYYIIEADTGWVEICGEFNPWFMFDCDSVYVNPGDTLLHDMHLPVLEAVITHPEKNEAFRLSPNPASDFAIIKIPLFQEIPNIEIFSSDGQKTDCTFSSANNNQILINTSKLKTGLYLISLTSSGYTEKMKLLVIH